MTKHLKQFLLRWLPYMIIAAMGSKLGHAWRLTEHLSFSERILRLPEAMTVVFQSLLPSIHLQDVFFGVFIGVTLKVVVYLKGKNAKKYRKDVEHGSARWGTSADIKPFVDSVSKNNIILTQTESLTLNNRPKDPKTGRNKNVLVIGGSGSGKTRNWLKPNLMQCHSSYVVTDPKGSVVIECGNLLLSKGYRIKILNTVNFTKSMHYNPFVYIRSEKDILKLVTALIANTKGEGKMGMTFG